VLFRIELLVSIPILAMLAAGTAAAHPPEEVRYLPREGAVMVVWKGDADASGYNVYQYVVTDLSSPLADSARVKVNKEPIKTTSFLVENLKNGTRYHFRVSAIEGDKETEVVGPAGRDELGKAVCVVPQKPVKLAGIEGFVGHNIGTDFPGSHEVDAQGQITMKASGWDIYEDCDGFYFLAKPMTGDMTITVRLVSGPTETADGNGWNLAGPMIRESLDGRSRLIFAQMARDNTARPIWARLVRKGDNFSAFYSVDGKEFKEIGPTRSVAAFAKEAYVGLAVTAHEDGEYTTAVLDNLTITQP
jgi:hypothetical protein